MKMDGFTFRTTAPNGRPIDRSVPGVEAGIVGVITNHSWLDNPTFRGMRQSLMRSFERIYVLDLHGSTTKKEKAPDGSREENVFDIEQGVAISLFVKKPGIERGVWRGDLWGTRLSKYEVAASGSLQTVEFFRLQPVSPHYLFVAHDLRKRSAYEKGMLVKDMFVIGGTGIITKRDKLAIQFEKAEIWSVVQEFARLPAEAARDRFQLPADVRDWKVADARADVLADGPDRGRIRRILYRPFDERFTYYTGRARGFLGWPVERLAKHMTGGNIALVTARTNKSLEPDHFFVTTLPAETKAGESTVQSYNFPLYFTNEQENRAENLTLELRTLVDSRFEHHYTPEEILGYIYAVLHAPTYRIRFAEFLRIDFPRIPFPEAADDFEALSGLGWALVQAHLLREYPRRGLGGYHGRGHHTVEAVRYSEAEQEIAINKTQSFRPVPRAVWDFHIGGYQVLDKYLKSRKGRTLSLDEIGHVEAVADSLAFTIEQMTRIDGAYRSAFPDYN
jgi:predicted helicase